MCAFTRVLILSSCALGAECGGGWEENSQTLKNFDVVVEFFILNSLCVE